MSQRYAINNRPASQGPGNESALAVQRQSDPGYAGLRGAGRKAHRR